MNVKTLVWCKAGDVEQLLSDEGMDMKDKRKRAALFRRIRKKNLFADVIFYLVSLWLSLKEPTTFITLS